MMAEALQDHHGLAAGRHNSVTRAAGRPHFAPLGQGDQVLRGQVRATGAERGHGGEAGLAETRTATPVIEARA